MLEALGHDASLLEEEQGALSAAQSSLDLTRRSYAIGSVGILQVVEPSAWSSRPASASSAPRRSAISTPPSFSSQWAAAGGTGARMMPRPPWCRQRHPRWCRLWHPLPRNNRTPGRRVAPSAVDFSSDARSEESDAGCQARRRARCAGGGGSVSRCTGARSGHRRPGKRRRRPRRDQHPRPRGGCGESPPAPCGRGPGGAAPGPEHRCGDAAGPHPGDEHGGRGGGFRRKRRHRHDRWRRVGGGRGRGRGGRGHWHHRRGAGRRPPARTGRSSCASRSTAAASCCG